jgi:hypothetical protein
VHRHRTGGDGVKAPARRSSDALPRRRSEGGRESREVVQFAAAGVVADVRVERTDRRNRCSWYALRLASTDADVTVRMVGLCRRGGHDDLGSVAVAPGSVGSARFAVTTPRSGPYRAMFLEVLSDRVLLRVEAPRPPAAPRLRALKAGAALFSIGLIAIVAGVSAIPRAAAPAAPLRVTPALPVAVRAVQPGIARVVSFGARRDASPDGESVLASYLATGDRGSVTLLDSKGKLVASAPFARVGTTRLAVPPAYRSAALAAQITVRRGDTHAVVSVALPPNALLPAPTAAPAVAESGIVPDAAPPAIGPAPRAGTGGIVTVEGRAVAGGTLSLLVAAHSGAIHLELQDETGVTLAETDVAPGVSRAALPIPPAQSATTYLLALHYARNGGEETVVRTVAAAAR